MMASTPRSQRKEFGTGSIRQGNSKGHCVGARPARAGRFLCRVLIALLLLLADVPESAAQEVRASPGEVRVETDAASEESRGGAGVEEDEAGNASDAAPRPSPAAQGTQAGGGAAEAGVAEGAGGANAQVWAGIEEFVVTGYASSLVSDLTAANSVVAWSEEDLVALGAGDISDLAAYTPSLEIVTSGATTPTFFIRGVGLNDFNPNSTGSVSIYQDDVAINAPAMQLSVLYDTESVNVLRGPQATGQARNASAGAIKIYSRKPSGDFSGSFRSDFGNFDARDIEGAVEMPLVKDVLSARFAFRVIRRDGIMKNRCAEAPPFGQRDSNPSPSGSTSLPPVSICGERVPGFLGGNPLDPLMPPPGASPIPEGLAGNVNDTDVWAARAMIRFEPIPEMSWLLKVQGSRRDELSRLGQFIGTRVNTCVNGFICTGPLANVSPELRGQVRPQFLGGLIGGPGLGSNPNAGTIGIDVRNRLRELAPCLLQIGINGCDFQSEEVRVGATLAQRQLARELARDLDSAPLKGEFNRTGPTTNDIWGIALNGEFELPGEIQMKTATGFDRYRRKIDIDLDFSPLRLFETITNDDGWQFFQSITFDGTLAEASSTPITWDVGGWVLREDLDARVNNIFDDSPGANAAGVKERFFGQKIWNAAGFAHVSIDIFDDFTLDGGFRYNFDFREFDMDITQIGLGPDGREFQIRETFDSPTGSVRLTYRFNADVSVFWKYTRGWKPGTINATASQFTGPTVASPERIDAFETGFSGTWLDGALTLGGSFFFYNYKNFQLFTAQQFFGGNTEFVVLNADNAEVIGVELDGDAHPWKGGLLQVRFAWLETQFLDFTRRDQFLNTEQQLVGNQEPFIFRDQQNAGNPLLNSPRFKVSLTAQQEFEIGRYGFVTLRYDATWTDKTFFDQTKGNGIGNLLGEQFLPDNTIGQEAFWLHNMRVSWRSSDDRLELAGWIRNIENKRFKTFAFDATNFQNTTIFFVGDPRTYGLSLGIKFF